MFPAEGLGISEKCPTGNNSINMRKPTTRGWGVVTHQLKKFLMKKRCKKTRKNQVHHTTPSILAQTKYPTSSQQSFHLSTDQVTKFTTLLLPFFHRPSIQVQLINSSILPQTKYPTSSQQSFHLSIDQVQLIRPSIVPQMK